jgi:hypothetical protein
VTEGRDILSIEIYPRVPHILLEFLGGEDEDGALFEDCVGGYWAGCEDAATYSKTKLCGQSRMSGLLDGHE